MKLPLLHRLGLVQKRMVGWYEPVQLARTAFSVAIATLFGRHADRRVLQALTDTGELRKKYFYEVTVPTDEDLWIDYASDLGDGFDSTYTIAYNLTRHELEVAVCGSHDLHTTKRGTILIFGGDEVYPAASHDEYRDRLIGPYEAAFRSGSHWDAGPQPTVFAIPGNHDWYDSLSAFSETFCSQRPFAGWRTLQNRSYFALKLPRGWWLFGTDMQLGSSLDASQIEYFRGVMRHVGTDDRIILCNAEPHWITAKMYAGDPAYDNRNMDLFESEVLKGRVAVSIAGDRHYYRRHERVRGADPRTGDTGEPKHKIVSGGGGAFLHPTHNEGVERLGGNQRFVLRASYPDERVSKRLSWRNLVFPLWNLPFGAVTGAFYVLTAQAFLSYFQRMGTPSIGEAAATVARAMLLEPTALYWVLTLIVGFVFFTDAHSRWYRLTAGPIHALAHLGGVFIAGWITLSIITPGGAEGRQFYFWEIALAAVMIFAAGAVIGPFIMGAYLLISLNCFGLHHNEAFSALKIPDYKNFLRLRIAPDGALTIYPIGIERVHRRWKRKKGSRRNAPAVSPTDELPATRPFLIEPPIHVTKAGASPGPAPSTDVHAVVPRAV